LSNSSCERITQKQPIDYATARKLRRGKEACGYGARWSVVGFQRYAQIGVVLVNLKEAWVGKMRVRCGVHITRLNDRDWWTFGSQEEVDCYIASCRVQNVEFVKSMTELKGLMRKKVEAEKIVESREQQTKKRKSSDEEYNLKRRIENLSLEDVERERKRKRIMNMSMDQVERARMTHRMENLTIVQQQRQL
jgi:hypothetical protein